MNGKAGRPETHPTKKIIGFTPEMLDAVEKWRARQRPVPNLSEAMRRLIDLGLASSRPPRAGASIKQTKGGPPA